MTAGVIYILTNPSFPNYVKIGYADDLDTRLRQFNVQSCVPFSFRAYAVYETDNRLTDTLVHDMIDRLNPALRAVEVIDGKKRKREFFSMAPEDAFSILESIAEVSGTKDRLRRFNATPEQLDAEREAVRQEEEFVQRRARFSFSDLGIKPGSQITYVNDASIQATVVDDRHIEYKGEITTVSRLATRLLEYPRVVQGSLYFNYEGETLVKRRDRIEQEQSQVQDQACCEQSQE